MYLINLDLWILFYRIVKENGVFKLFYVEFNLKNYYCFLYFNVLDQIIRYFIFKFWVYFGYEGNNKVLK